MEIIPDDISPEQPPPEAEDGLDKPQGQPPEAESSPARQEQIYSMRIVPRVISLPKSVRMGLALLGGGLLLGAIVWGLLGFGGYTLFGKPPSAGNLPTAAVTLGTPTLQLPSVTPNPTATITPEPTIVPTLGIGSKRTAEKDGMIEVYVPEGIFPMGSDSNKRAIYLDAFWIDQTVVTNRMYVKCVSAGACSSQHDKSSTLHPSYYGNSQFDDYPLIKVNWYQADTYCKWAGRQLPTDAQWEKAARGTDGRRYPWGDGIDKNKANYNRNVGDVVEVGSYPGGASPYGALDMAGNVWEWVADWYDGYYSGKSTNRNPVGPSFGELKVLRGGSWGSVVFNMRSAGRYGNDPYNRDSDVGFRCSFQAP